MLLLHKKKHGIHFYTAWFAKEPIKKKGIIAYREYMGECPAEQHAGFDTLITDLCETEDEIKQHFSKNCRYYVNRAAREPVSVSMSCGKEISDEEIAEFLDFFDAFWKSKGSLLNGKENLRQELQTYRDMGALSITAAYVNGEKAVYHTHIVDDKVVRLLHSASLYRLQEDNDGKTKNVIGIANRFLHYEEMKYFKNQGKITYDWGGAGKGEDVIHITEFKESFGGTPVKYYDFEQVNGILAKTFKLLVKILGK